MLSAALNGRFYRSINDMTRIIAEKVPNQTNDLVKISCWRMRKSSSQTPYDLQVVYRFPYIAPAQGLLRLKYYPLASTALSIPIGQLLKLFGYCVSDSALLLSYLGFALTVPLAILSYNLSGLVGLVYINEKHDTVRISYLDGWGKRQNVLKSVSDIIPFSEGTPSRLDAAFVKIKCYSQPDFYKINLTLGVKPDAELFTKVFGKHDLY